MEENNMMNQENYQVETTDNSADEVTYFGPDDDSEGGLDVKSIAIGAGVAAAATAAITLGPKVIGWAKRKRLEHALKIVEKAEAAGEFDDPADDFFEDEDDVVIENVEVNPQEEDKKDKKEK